MKRGHTQVLILLSPLVLASCVTMAAPVPLATLGGPETAPVGRAESALAVGTGGVLFSQEHAGGSGWLGRWRQGLGNGWDAGVDALGFQRSDKSTLAAKVAVRHQPVPWLRWEAGLGGADDSEGKSLGADLAVTVGGSRGPWGWYASARGAGSHGYPGKVFGSGEDRPADATFAVAAAGLTGRSGPGQRFAAEVGGGPVWVRGGGFGTMLYLGVAVLFDLGTD